MLTICRPLKNDFTTQNNRLIILQMGKIKYVLWHSSDYNSGSEVQNAPVVDTSHLGFSMF